MEVLIRRHVGTHHVYFGDQYVGYLTREQGLHFAISYPIDTQIEILQKLKPLVEKL